MKVKTVVVGLLLLVGFWVGLPYLFITINGYLGWPTFNSPILKVVGGVLVLSAALTDLYLFGLFRVFGKGTPVPVEPSKQLVFEGPYKWTRNPMYLGHLTVYFGLFLYFGYPALLMLMFLAAVALHLLVTKWEEPGLKDRLGKEYLEYMKKVPRWL